MVILVIVNFEQLNADWVVSGRIARAFSWSGATRPTTLGIFKAFDRFGMLVFPNSSQNLMRLWASFLPLFHPFSLKVDFRWFCLGIPHKSIQLKS